MLLFQRFVERSILPIIVVIVSLTKKKTQIVAAKPKKIAIIRLWALGETVLCLPMVKELKKSLPETKITIFCTNKNRILFEGKQFVDEIITIEIKNIFKLIKHFKSYEIIIDTEPHFNVSALLSVWLGKTAIGYNYSVRARLYDINIEYNDKQHAVYTICDLLKPLNIDVKPKELVELEYYKEDEKIDQILKSLKGKTIIGIHAGSADRAPWRKWPESRFIELIKKLLEDENKVVMLTGGKEEKDLNKIIVANIKNNRLINLQGINLKQLFYIIKKMDLFISNDTGPMHIAAAQKTKTIGLFGPNTPVRFGPFPIEKNYAFYKPTDESPCINVHKGEFRECLCKGRCMKNITVEEVFEKAKQMLKI